MTQAMRALQRRSWLAKLLLPAILFRALIPAGFMPAIDADGGLGLTFCPVIVRAGPGTTLVHHHGHDGGTADTAGTGHHLLICPFAAAAGPAPLPGNFTAATGPADVLPPAGRPIEPGYIPTIIRAQSARAPPATS